MVSKTYGAAVIGVDAHAVTIEVNVGRGLYFYMSGLPDSAVKQSEHRVSAALQVSGYRMPRTKVIVNLAPADMRKEGSAYDLAIALAILRASGQLAKVPLHKYMIMGELSLDGTLTPIRGVLPIAIEAGKMDIEALILPEANAREAAIVNNIHVIGVKSLAHAIDYLTGREEISPSRIDTREVFITDGMENMIDFKDVQGQTIIKRSLEIAAAGGHNVIMIGPPGAGKTMLAKRLPGILPPLTLQEALETTKIHSVAGKLGPDASLIVRRPYRSPHHTISDVALVGGGGFPQPGEISLAHNGVLFLDELPEFRKSVLEVMRQPMEERKVTISRARVSVDYPASFMLVASMNPCPCGFYNHPDKECVCPPGSVRKYLNRISGPLLDRIDLHVEVTPVTFDEMTTDFRSESSESIRDRVIAARNIQLDRFRKYPGIHSNAHMPVSRIREFCAIDAAGRNLLRTAMDKLGLSARAYDRILKVSRTIADLAGSDAIDIGHLAEAIQFRSLDREGWSG